MNLYELVVTYTLVGLSSFSFFTIQRGFEVNPDDDLMSKIQKSKSSVIMLFFCVIGFIALGVRG